MRNRNRKHNKSHMITQSSNCLTRKMNCRKHVPFVPSEIYKNNSEKLNILRKVVKTFDSNVAKECTSREN